MYTFKYSMSIRKNSLVILEKASVLSGEFSRERQELADVRETR